MLSVLEKSCFKTVDVELSTEMSTMAQETSPKTVIINDNILNVNFLPNSFDYILALAVLHNFPLKDLKELLIKIKNWLKDEELLIELGFSIEKCNDYVDSFSGKNWLEYKLTKL